MKKLYGAMNKLHIGRILACFIFTTIFINKSITCLAGDIPEALLSSNYPVYFGEVKEVNTDSITIVQTTKIKGEFSEGKEITYPDYIFTESPKIGEIYLCGYIDENNPLYIWEVDCYDTSSLVISNVDDMSKRMQKYLNDGLFAIADKKASKINADNNKEIISTIKKSLKTKLINAGSSATESNKLQPTEKNRAALGTTAALLLINVF